MHCAHVMILSECKSNCNEWNGLCCQNGKMKNITCQFVIFEFQCWWLRNFQTIVLELYLIRIKKTIVGFFTRIYAERTREKG